MPGTARVDLIVPNAISPNGYPFEKISKIQLTIISIDNLFLVALTDFNLILPISQLQSNPMKMNNSGTTSEISQHIEDNLDKLLLDVDESTLTKAERNEREIMTYLLKIKNGTPPQRKSGLR